jgi:quercetin dioxygenase-like cupin family protein
MSQIEVITARDKVLALIVRGDTQYDRTTFVTPDDFNLQVGFVVYPAGGTIAPHLHLPLPRQITGTSEVLVVRSGRCVVDLFDDDRRAVTTRELAAGDVIVLMAGGHGFRMLEDTVLLEVKQGPYTGLQEKERFEP